MTSHDPQPDFDAFHLALGRFLTRFSGTEAFMQTILWRLARVQSPTAQAVFSGIRTEGVMQYINRIAAAEKWSKTQCDLLQFVFTQLGHINKLRNNILHYGAEPEGHDAWIVTNKQFAHVPENVSRIVISPLTLDMAASDLEKIETHLIDFVYSGHLRGSDRDGIDLILARTWQYKPPPQSGGRRKTQKTHRGRERRRRS